MNRGKLPFLIYSVGDVNVLVPLTAAAVAVDDVVVILTTYSSRLQKCFSLHDEISTFISGVPFTIFVVKPFVQF